MDEDNKRQTISVSGIRKQNQDVADKVTRQAQASARIVGPVFFLFGVGLLLGFVELENDLKSGVGVWLTALALIFLGLGFTYHGWSENFRK